MAGKAVSLLEQTAEVMRNLSSAMEQVQQSLREMGQALPSALEYVRGILAAIEQTPQADTRRQTPQADTRGQEEDVISIDAEPSFGLMEDNDDQRTSDSFF